MVKVIFALEPLNVSLNELGELVDLMQTKGAHKFLQVLFVNLDQSSKVCLSNLWLHH
jgi:hypothetical protein